MRYHILHIETSFAEEWQKDLFDQAICDLGVDTIDAEDYYIPTDLWEQNREAIESLILSSPLHGGIEGGFSISPCPDENWNAAWEAEHPVQELPLGVRIVPHCAFGAGYHETTSMMINALLENAKMQDASSFVLGTSSLGTLNHVLDNGCGTGVLGIFAKRLGAETVVAIDIDDKSVENARENAALNGVEIDVRLGDLSSFVLSPFNLILSNIHRNILLSQMSLYARLLCAGGELWMSGFYEADCPALQAAAEAEGLTLTDVLANGEWRMMKCRKEERPPRT